ncbi:hypothetical protein ACVW04_000595 [Bradyrhizobium sp. LM2.3]
MRPGVKPTLMPTPASFAAFSTAAVPPSTMRSASETFFAPDDALKSFWIASSLPRTFES